MAGTTRPPTEWHTERMTPSVMNDPPAAAEARLSYGGHPSQFVDYRRSASPDQSPLAIMIHGGFWRAKRDLTYAGHLCIALGEAGYTTANIEYRRVGEEGGAWPGTFDDVKRAIEFARDRVPEFGGDPARTVVLGHSAGGHLALWIASEIVDLRGVISLGGVASLRRAWELHLSNDAVVELIGGTPDEFPERYRFADPEQRPTAVPRVLIHGSADDIVPVEISRLLAAEARVIELPDVDHFGLIDPYHAAWKHVIGELEALTPGRVRVTMQ
jgi:acetyl esterase/lipase